MLIRIRAIQVRVAIDWWKSDDIHAVKKALKSFVRFHGPQKYSCMPSTSSKYTKFGMYQTSPVYIRIFEDVREKLREYRVRSKDTVGWRIIAIIKHHNATVSCISTLKGPKQLYAK